MVTSFSRNLIAILILAIVAIVAILAYLRSTDLNFSVKKSGFEGKASLKTQAAPENHNGISVEQSVGHISGNVTGIGTNGAQTSNLPDINVSQNIGTVEGSVVGVDLSKKIEEKP